VLAIVRRYGAAGRFYILPHARQRAAGRGVTAGDIRHGLANARTASWQAEHETWRVESSDLSGDALTMAVAIEASVIVVTVF
jgi:hypothetical protein